MRPRPVDLANLCVVLKELTGACSRQSLLERVGQTRAIGCFARPQQILSEATRWGLLFDKGKGDVSLEKQGFAIARAQGKTSEIVAEEAAALLRRVYMDPLCPRGCDVLLQQFQIDGGEETYVLDRTFPERFETTYWLKTLHSLGILEIFEDRASVVRQYVPLVSDFLYQLRTDDSDDAEESGIQRNKVGAMAEELAMKFERARLKHHGHNELAHLVLQVSKIDGKAGYDIRSFLGKGDDPSIELYVEVKGTTSNMFQFVWTLNERKVARDKADQYWIYLYRRVDLESKTAEGPKRVQNPTLALQHDSFVVEPIDVRVVVQQT